MRSVRGVTAVLLMCVALTSCSSAPPEKAFMGVWKGTHQGTAIELSFTEEGVCTVKLPDETHTGTWSVDPEGNARMVFDDAKATATRMSDGTLTAREEGGLDTVVFEKVSKKK